MRYERKLVEAIKNYFFEKWEDRKEAIHELKRYRQEFRSCSGYNLYAYGNILPYYYDMRNFCLLNGVKMNEDNAIMQRTFEKYIEKAVDEILKEEEED